MYNYLAEFIGTLLLVYVYFATSNPIAVGATLMLVSLLGVSIGGIHINPAITVAAVSYGQMPSSRLVPTILSQIMGGLFGLEIYKRYTK